MDCCIENRKVENERLSSNPDYVAASSLPFKNKKQSIRELLFLAARTISRFHQIKTRTYENMKL
jgi:hypothetical protein